MKLLVNKNNSTDRVPSKEDDARFRDKDEREQQNATPVDFLRKPIARGRGR